MKIKILTTSPRTHLEVCSLINLHKVEILENKFDEEGFYSFFLLESLPIYVDDFILIPDIKVHWNKEIQ